jgi:hypothetical protein
MSSMDVENIKTELFTLIKGESDHYILEAIHTLLKKASLDPLLKDKLSSRARISENDIEEGRTMNRKELERKLNDRLGI